MFGGDPKAAVESFRLPALAAEVTGAAEDPIEGDRRIRNLCGSSADASRMECYHKRHNLDTMAKNDADGRRAEEQQMLNVSAQCR